MNELSLDNYASTLVEDIHAAIEGEVLSIAQQALIDAINQTVYLRQGQYRQTKDLLGAVEVTDIKKSRGMATFSVIINASALNVEIRDGELNAHADVNGSPFQESLIEVLDQGTKSYNPIYMHPAHGFFDKAYDDMDAKVVVAMANSLRAKGYKVTIY